MVMIEMLMRLRGSYWNQEMCLYLVENQGLFFMGSKLLFQIQLLSCCWKIPDFAPVDSILPSENTEFVHSFLDQGCFYLIVNFMQISFRS